MCCSITARSLCRAACEIRTEKARSNPASATRKKTPLKGLRFESLEEAQAYLDHWEERWADTRIHGTTKRQVAAMFAEERPALLPLPVEPFRYYQYGERTVHLDGCVEVEAAYYGAPPGWIGRRVHVQWNDVARPADRSAHRATAARAFAATARPPSHPGEGSPHTNTAITEQLLRRAEIAGPHIGALCQAMHRNQGQEAVRRILGVLTLVKEVRRRFHR